MVICLPSETAVKGRPTHSPASGLKAIHSARPCQVAHSAAQHEKYPTGPRSNPDRAVGRPWHLRLFWKPWGAVLRTSLRQLQALIVAHKTSPYYPGRMGGPTVGSV